MIAYDIRGHDLNEADERIRVTVVELSQNSASSGEKLQIRILDQVVDYFGCGVLHSVCDPKDHLCDQAVEAPHELHPGGRVVLVRASLDQLFGRKRGIGGHELRGGRILHEQIDLIPRKLGIMDFETVHSRRLGCAAVRRIPERFDLNSRPDHGYA